VSQRTHKAIFERVPPPLDQWTGEGSDSSEITREWVSLEPLTVSSQRAEFNDAGKITTVGKFIVKVTHSPTMATVTTACRMKVAKTPPVDEDNPTADTNYRIFNIDQIVNVREQNRILELMVTERDGSNR
jgi:hypothetical protein